MDNGLEGEDRISKLPHDILLSILFQLEMKEAAKTSILSKTWRYLWTYWTHLDFDHLQILPQCEMYIYFDAVEETKYYNWVNQVVSLHSGQSITNFKLKFALSETREHNVDNWVKFALSKRVKDLELDLPGGRLLYTLKPSLLETDISFLTCLRLTKVNVTGDLLELVLSKCHLLERLFVEWSRTLVRLKVVSLKLKHLSIRLCPWLEQLEIDAVNLFSLDYDGDPTIEFKNMPLSLAELTLEGDCCRATVPICQQMAGFALQLSRFSLRILMDGYTKDYCIAICNIPAKGLPCFSNLKFLELTFWEESIVDIPSITRLLGACPLLCEFKLQVCWINTESIGKEARVFLGLEPLPLGWGECDNYIYDHSIEEDDVHYKALPCLKVFHFVGFSGDDDDVNLVLTILDMATQLHTFICHPFMPDPFWNDNMTDDMANVCRSRATKLKNFVAPRVHDYVILNDYDIANIL